MSRGARSVYFEKIRVFKAGPSRLDTAARNNGGPYASGVFDDDEAELEIIPYKVSIYNGENASMEDDADLEGGN